MVTMVDHDLRTEPYNGHPAYPAWVPKVQGRQVDRLSGSLINKHLPGVFGASVGLVLAPVQAQACLWCSYPFDAGSNGPMPCRVGSPAEGGAYPPSRFAEMMRQPQGHHSGVSAVYNEVVLHDDGAGSTQWRPVSGCYSAALPAIVEAVFLMPHANAAAAAAARVIRDRFSAHFRLPSSSAPLLLT